MKKKVLYWTAGILFAVGMLISFGNSPKPQVEGVNTVVTSTPTEIPTVIPSDTPTPSQTPTPTKYFLPTHTTIQSPQSTTQDNGLSNNNSYTNSSGNEVHSPAYSNNGSVPSGATARCGDGTYSFSQHHRGTCSYHGGVAQWL